MGLRRCGASAVTPDEYESDPALERSFFDIQGRLDELIKFIC